jgi:hypothetical protein
MIGLIIAILLFNLIAFMSNGFPKYAEIEGLTQEEFIIQSLKEAVQRRKDKI